MARGAAVAAARRRVVGEAADQAARATRWVHRRRKLSGAGWVHTLVLGGLGAPAARGRPMCQTAANAGVAMSPQGLDQRFTAAGAACLAAVIAARVAELLRPELIARPLLERFGAVVVQESTTVPLPPVLAEHRRGGGGNPAGAAARKAPVGLALGQGTLVGPFLADGRSADTRLALAPDPLPAGALRLQDLGYFDRGALGALGASGRFWLSRLTVNTRRYPVDGQRRERGVLLAAQTAPPRDRPILLGTSARLPGRLLARRAPATVAAERQRRSVRAGARRPSGAGRLDATGHRSRRRPPPRDRSAGALPGALADQTAGSALETGRHARALAQRQSLAHPR